MEQLRVIGTEDDVLVLATESGETFALAWDDALAFQLRRARREREAESRVARPSPRDIQTRIRAGLTAEEVAEVLGASVEDVRRYEGPVLAEREHVLSQALAVPVLVGAELEPDSEATFGVAVRAKLAEANASGERWTSWKDASGWVVKLEFRAGDVDRDARWEFDPRRSTLTPANADATQLSRQGSLPEGLIPRLRALEPTGAKDDSRFDSGAFGPRKKEAVDAPEPEAGDERASAAAREAATKRATETVVTTSPETADLLEALRRRRGQRDVPAMSDTPAVEEIERAPVALFDALEPGYDEDLTPPVDDEPVDLAPTQLSASRRRGRASLPSWDEIVFGARTDE
ncbi:septation protein SepH [Microbacterium sediminicola]|uniref:Septation protein SepH n=1 Tax=Microbacterium sediminicola TaxID=415210 RepID=A0ABN2HSX8_9MICO